MHGSGMSWAGVTTLVVATMCGIALQPYNPTTRATMYTDVYWCCPPVEESMSAQQALAQAWARVLWSGRVPTTRSKLRDMATLFWTSLEPVFQHTKPASLPAHHRCGTNPPVNAHASAHASASWHDHEDGRRTLARSFLLEANSCARLRGESEFRSRQACRRSKWVALKTLRSPHSVFIGAASLQQRRCSSNCSQVVSLRSALHAAGRCVPAAQHTLTRACCKRARSLEMVTLQKHRAPAFSPSVQCVVSTRPSFSWYCTSVPIALTSRGLLRHRCCWQPGPVCNGFR